MNRLYSALQLMVALAVTIGIVYVFMHVTKVMWLKAPAGSAPTAAELAGLAAQHRGITILAMLLGGLIAMLVSFAVMDSTPREQALTMVLMPIPLLMTMALAVEMAAHRTAGIALLALVMGVGTYLRKFVPRFGPRAFLYGILLFVGYTFGFLSGGAIMDSQLGWIAVVLWLAVVINFLIMFVVGRPLERGRLDRTARAFRARCRGVIAATIALLDATKPRERERARRLLHRRLTRLNETALVIDASIAAPHQLPLGASHADAHDELFELELLVHNIARTAERLSAANLPPRLHAEIRAWLAELRAGHSERAAQAAGALDRKDAATLVVGLSDDDVARVHHLADAVVDVAAAVRAWPRFSRDSAGEGSDAPFESAVTLIFGDLPGSALVSAQAAAPGTDRRGALLSRLKLDAPAQLAIRMMIAVGAAAALGSLLSERRFYWAVIAVFISFMGANTSGEQITKALNRVLGTVVGILVGSLLAHAIGRSSWSILVIVVALGFGMYFMKVSYGLMVLGVTVMVSQLYEQLGEYSNHLLVLRVEETAIGAAVATFAAVLIFPIDTRRAATVAASGYLSALEDLLGRVGDRVRMRAADTRLTSTSRALDHANQQLLATAWPLRYTPFRPDRLEHNLALFTQTAHHARNLVATVEGEATLDPRVADSIGVALEIERHAVAALNRSLTDDGAPPSAHRLDGEPLAILDQTLAAAGRGQPHRRQRNLLRQIDRLDETIGELHTNLNGRRPEPARVSADRGPTCWQGGS